MFYSLLKNVYVVYGVVKSCIYDFNNSKLYHINNTLSEVLRNVINGDIKVVDTKSELLSLLASFEELRLIEKVAELRQNNISEICNNNISCHFAWIEITNKCNMKCLHCYNELESKRDFKIMSLDNYKLVVNSLLKAKIQRIQIIGGEPFFNGVMLKNMLDYTVGKFDFIEIFTNGTLISDDWFKYLADNEIHIALSVYSYEPCIHDKVTRCNGSHRKTTTTIRKLKEWGICYRVCNVLMKDVPLGVPNSEFYKLNSNKDVVRMVGRADFSLLSDELIKKKLITKETFKKPITKEFCSRAVGGHNCFQDKVYISADMIVFPCVMERRVNYGVIDESLEIRFNDKIRKFNKDMVDECAECEFRYACFDCRPDSLSGDFKEKPWYCTYMPKLGKWSDIDEFIYNIKKKWGSI